MRIVGMNHFTVLAKDLEATKDFYVAVLGLVEGYLQSLASQVRGLYAGDATVLHIVVGSGLAA